jgi:CRP/FNR family transcriptional regulator, nitrogen fixation regulation protein
MRGHRRTVRGDHAQAWFSVPVQTIEYLRQASSADHLERRLIPSDNTEAFNLQVGRIGVNVPVATRELIFHEHDAAESVYKVVSGSVCTCKILSDGRRQIVAFYLPGEFFDFEGADEHRLSAEAVSNAKVLVIKKRVLAAAASRDAAIERQVLLLISHELARLQDRVLLLIKNAQERVGEFILDMEKRAPAGEYVELPMKRQDIADYLGLTIETVSRVLTALEKRAVIEILPRQGVVVRSHSLLQTVMADRSETPAIWSRLKYQQAKTVTAPIVGKHASKTRAEEGRGQPRANYVGMVLAGTKVLQNCSTKSPLVSGRQRM